MPSYPLRAMVLRKTKLGETDTILTLLAADGRQVRAVAKGLRKPGGRFGGRLEPYAVVDLLMHTGRNLDVISEAVTVEPHAGLRENLDRSTAAAVVADLLDKISVEGQVDEKLFGLATTTLDVMESVSLESLSAVVVAFIAKAMAIQGYRPQLHACAVCASDAADSDLFSVPAGGVICDDCAALEGSHVHFSREGRAWLDRLLRVKTADIEALDMPRAAVADCFELLRAFVAYHIPARLKALDFYAWLLTEP